MTKEVFVEKIEENADVDTLFSVKYKKPPKEYKNGWMFILGLSDKTGEIEAKYWGGDNKSFVKKVYNQIEVGDVVNVKGKSNKFKNRMQINVEEGEGNLKKAESFEIEDFVERAKRDPEDMLEELKEKLNSMRNPDLKRLYEKIFDDQEFVEALKKSPAAMFYHHAYIGGLLEHVLNMLDFAEVLSKKYESLDPDLLKFGCFIHDIGKIREFKITSHIKQSREGLLTGHMMIGQEILIEKINELESFPDNLKNKLIHIIASHHGERENGSVKSPMFPESAAVHYLDELDSQVRQYVDIKENAETDDFHIYNKNFGQIYLE